MGHGPCSIKVGNDLRMHPNVFILSLVLVFANSAPPVVTMVAGIISTELAPSPMLITLPAATMMIGLGVSAIPAALLMKRLGRKAGFLLSFSMATLAIFGVAYAIWIKHFLFFCLALLFVGGNMAFVGQFRFAAAESVSGENVGKAVSYVLFGGIFAAFLGPEMAKQAKDWVSDVPFVGSFICLGGLYVIGLLILMFYQNIHKADTANAGERRSIFEILVQPGVVLSITAGVVSYAVMVTIMMATPIQVYVMDGYDMRYVTLIIQAHLLGMFLPSLFTGKLIQRFGIVTMMATGLVCLYVSIVANIVDNEIFNYMIGLVLLGVGWNFLFISATTLLTRQYSFSERFKTQAANDFIIYSVMAMGSLSAGAMIHSIGWLRLNLLMLPILIGMTLLLVRYAIRKR